MKAFRLLITVVFCAGYLCQSQTNTDAYLKKISESKQDTTKVNLYNELAISLRGVSTDSTILYATKAAELAERIDFKKGLGFAYKNIGIGHFIDTEYGDALTYWKKSLAIFEEIEDKAGISNLQSNIGSIYQTKGDNITALDYFYKSIRIAEQIGDNFRIASALGNIGTVYSNDKKTYNQALEVYQQAIQLFEQMGENDSRNLCAINIAEIYLLQDKPQQVLSYLEAYLPNLEEDSADLSSALNLIAAAHKELGDLTQSEKKLRQAIKIAEEKNFKLQEIMALNNLGQVLTEKNQFNQAVANFKEALELSKSSDMLKDQQDAYEGLAEAHSRMGDFEGAFNYQQRFSEIRDSIKGNAYEETIGNNRFKYDFESMEQEIALLNTQNELNKTQIEKEATSRNLLLAVLALLTFIIFGFILQYRYVKRSHKRLDKERTRSENILLNILPKETAEELKKNGSIQAKKFDKVTVLFTDFKAFSIVAEKISPEKLVQSVDYYFKKFDEIIERNNLEKIKTIGDAYMCAGGLPAKNSTNAQDALVAAQEILAFVMDTEANPPENIYPFKVRIGINTGPVIAGVVGTKKFQYDIWGNTVNIAARMESNSEPGKINVSEHTYEMLKNKRKFQYRGEIEVKNGQKLKMYYLENDLG